MRLPPRAPVKGSQLIACALGSALLIVLVVLWKTNETFLSRERQQEYLRNREVAPFAVPGHSPQDQSTALSTEKNTGIIVRDADSYAQAAGRRDRVYCMVPTMYKRSRLLMWDAILKSWGPRCDVIKFFVDPAAPGEASIPPKYRATGSNVEAEIVVVPMKRRMNGKGLCQDGLPCRHIWEKVWRSWVHVYMNDLTSAEWFVKVDDDTYMVPSNLRRYVRKREWAHHDPHYFGFVVNIDRPPYRLISGVCTAMSRETVARLGARLLHLRAEYGPRSNFPNSHGACVDRDGATEERVTSKCLEEMGIYAEDTLEEGFREHVVPLGIPFSLTYYRKANSTSWYWAGKTRTRGTMRDCCSVHAWGIHGYKQPSRMLEMESYMTELSRDALRHKRDINRPGSDDYEHFDYILRLREGIADDFLSYPPVIV
ncbi:Glycoprotein-N-acetylgalactosamine 3-beta-galactosyltransferase 1 [Hondaea fermentalgiana]|uniref:Glycoprotein-N-acetylgalactosamine 3-beta-galactosyltransferase 1 n=1 Tax=Hondaea fermentalgiana TaxID=2315210 RepID=A0A2R5GAM4_9STRA|nr:Glycoprotein-N-acetylgalactosamine 3-beta-galactosyltransferase 1 [Hondaea fermentalgiana]|eukprot:GBG27359.1 Glycoprotein-N-acetylgalactosamine 3-beta-galactosyltransferase 1 [Hondaea fermentalgiana]